MDEDNEPFRPKSRRRWGSSGYLALIVIGVIIAICILLPLGQSALNPFRAITSALSGQPR